VSPKIEAVDFRELSDPSPLLLGSLCEFVMIDVFVFLATDMMTAIHTAIRC
jgi:hypothetical protein